MNQPEKQKQAAKDIVQSVLLPVVSGLMFFAWIYTLLQSSLPFLLVFPLIVLSLLLLYFFSGNVYAGVFMFFVTATGFLGAAMILSPREKTGLLAETLWLWGLFFLLERFRLRQQGQKNRILEEADVLDTRITLLDSRREIAEKRSADLAQRISNYRSLGGMIKVLGSTLEEGKLLPLIEETAFKFLGRGSWKVKKNTSNDIFARYIRDHHLPLLVRDLSSDTRFFIRRPRFSSLIALPIVVNGRFWGTLKGVAAEPDQFDEDDLRLLSVLDGIASIALANVRLFQKTQDLAITDGLTGLYVHNYFKERLAEEWSRSKSHALPLSMALLDVDHFKKINDAHGHPVGDIVLRQIASLLRRRLRETDFLSRYGGEEFGIIMPQTNIAEARQVCEELRRCAEAERFFLPIESFHPVQVKVTVSIGVAALGGSVKTEDELLRAADVALYAAKENGRNRVEADFVEKKDAAGGGYDRFLRYEQ
jgi:diguanylate cyclase (GGDEF)-like protein